VRVPEGAGAAGPGPGPAAGGRLGGGAVPLRVPGRPGPGALTPAHGLRLRAAQAELHLPPPGPLCQPGRVGYG